MIDGFSNKGNVADNVCNIALVLSHFAPARGSRQYAATFILKSGPAFVRSWGHCSIVQAVLAPLPGYHQIALLETLDEPVRGHQAQLIAARWTGR